MSSHDLLRHRLAEPPLPPRVATLRFLHGYVTHADSLESIRHDVRTRKAVNRRPLDRALEGMTAYLSSDLPPGELAQLVGWEANWVLDDPSDVGARAFLSTLVDILRDELAD